MAKSNAELIEFLEELTMRARWGRLQAIAIVTICQEARNRFYATTAWSPSGHDHARPMMAGIEELRRRFLCDRKVF